MLTQDDIHAAAASLDEAERSRSQTHGPATSHSPLPRPNSTMLSAPASRPERPVARMMTVGAPVAPIPSTRARFETRPSLAPNTAARKLPDNWSRPRLARARTTSRRMRSSAAMVAVASTSVSYSERASARCARASVNTDRR